MSRQRRKPMIVVLEVEVTTNTTHTNPLITKPLKWKKNEWLTSAEAWKVERRKQLPIFGKIGPNKKKRKKEWFETVESKDYGESQTNNNEQQNKHTITVTDRQDVTNQVQDVSNFMRKNFFLLGLDAKKANQRKNWLFILKF